MVERGGAFLGDQKTKRAWNLRFHSKADRHIMYVHLSGWICTEGCLYIQDHASWVCCVSLRVFAFACKSLCMRLHAVYCTYLSKVNRFLLSRQCFKISKEKYCVSFSIQVRDNGSFH